jgi:cellulose synthase/poly-beta-1,6-N-acetylglucosamine synthase-like glycosyltransferase
MLAEEAGTKIIRHDASAENTGGQIYTGIASAAGDVVAIVHTDTVLPAPGFTEIIEVLRRQSMIIGGAVGAIYDAAGWRFRALELRNNFRTVCLGISCREQVQFFRRKPVLEMDIFPNMPLAEDVEFSLRLHRLGRQIILFGNARQTCEVSKTSQVLEKQLFVAEAVEKTRYTVPKLL